jgi:hypothetical protein
VPGFERHKISGVDLRRVLDDMEVCANGHNASDSGRQVPLGPDPAPSFSTVGNGPGLQDSLRLAHAVVPEDRGQSEGSRETHHDPSEKGAPLPSVVSLDSQNREAHTYRVGDTSPENLRQQREDGGTERAAATAIP